MNTYPSGGRPRGGRPRGGSRQLREEPEPASHAPPPRRPPCLPSAHLPRCFAPPQRPRARRPVEQVLVSDDWDRCGLVDDPRRVWPVRHPPFPDTSPTPSGVSPSAAGSPPAFSASICC
jgi:hypothetical protein